MSGLGKHRTFWKIFFLFDDGTDMERKGRNLSYDAGRKQAEILLHALLSFVENSEESKDCKADWQAGTELWVTHSTLEGLAELTKKYNDSLEAEAIRNALNCLISLKILQDKRGQTNAKTKTNSKIWLFALKFPSIDKKENLNWLFKQGGKWDKCREAQKNNSAKVPKTAKEKSQGVDWQEIRRQLTDKNGNKFDEIILGQVALTLLDFSPDNFEACEVVKELINNSDDYFVPPFWLNKLQFNEQVEAIRRRVFLDSRPIEVSSEILEEENHSSREEIIDLIYSLNNIDDANPQKVETMLRLEKIITGNPEAIAPIIDVIKRSLRSNEDCDRYLLFKTLKYVQRIGSGNLELINLLILIINNHTYYESYAIKEHAISALTAIGIGNENVFNFIINLIDNDGLVGFVSPVACLGIILRDNLFSLAVAKLSCYLQDSVCQNNRAFYFDCYWTLYHCAENMTYPDFYQAWHQQEKVKDQE
ncbi:MAG: hypothetical protein V7L01_10285 [Nostoc sp.]|uniref:hypothetical protein n=1 Tax=Nostoc sp. TaxID=1180 RepID=UPI002FFA9452